MNFIERKIYETECDDSGSVKLPQEIEHEFSNTTLIAYLSPLFGTSPPEYILCCSYHGVRSFLRSRILESLSAKVYINLQRFLFRRATELIVDMGGNISIPEELRTPVNISGEIAIVYSVLRGGIKKIEIWNRERYYAEHINGIQ